MTMVDTDKRDVIVALERLIAFIREGKVQVTNLSNSTSTDSTYGIRITTGQAVIDYTIIKGIY